MKGKIRLDSTLAGLALGVGAALGTTGCAQGEKAVEQPKKIEVTQEVKDAKAAALKADITLGASREDMVKHIVFPDWLPVTEDGQFDSEKAGDMFNQAGLNNRDAEVAFKEYMAAAQKGGDCEEAFEKFAEQITGGDQGKKEVLYQVKDVLQTAQESNPSKDLVTQRGRHWLLLGLVTLAALANASAGIADKNEHPEIGFIAHYVGLLSAVSAGALFVRMETAKDVYFETYRQMYNTYVSQEIKAAAAEQKAQSVQPNAVSGEAKKKANKVSKYPQQMKNPKAEKSL